MKKNTQAEQKKITVADLQDQFGMIGPRSILLCEYCGSEYSAHKGDYFALPDDHIMTCCGAPMIRVVKHETYELV